MYLVKRDIPLLVSVLVLMASSIAPAEAALNPAIGPAFTGLQTDVLGLVDMVWPVLIAVTIAFIILRLFPKAANKAV